MSSLARSVVVGASLAGALWVLAASRADVQVGAPTPGGNEAAIERALEQEADFDYTDAPLLDVIDDIADKFDIPVQLDKKALDDSGIAEDTPITRFLRRVSLRSALGLMLEEFDMTYVVRDEVLLITTQSEADNMLVTKVYQVADLVTADPDFIPASQSPMLGIVNVGGAWKGYSALVSLITECVQPTTWPDVGGPGSIMAHKPSQSLVFSQTQSAHDDAAELLAALRAVREVQRAAGKALPPAPAEPAYDKLYLRVYRLYDYLRGTGYPSIQSFMCVADDEAPAGKTPSTPAEAAPAQPRTAKSSEPAAAPPNQAPPNQPTGTQPPRAPHGVPTPANQPQPNQPSVAELERQAQEIVDALPRLIEPSSWADAGGQGTLRLVAGSLVVRQTRRVHDEIVGFLQLIGPVRASPIHGPGAGMLGPVRSSYPPSPLAPRGAAPNWPTQAEPRPGRSLAAIERPLAAKTDCVFENAPLAEVVGTLKTQHEIEIQLDVKALDDAGVGTDTPITCRLQGISLGSALRLILREFDLTYVLHKEVLLITTKAEAENLLVLKVYPVLDLCAENYADLIGVISANIEPTTWEDVGGPGVIRVFQNCGALVVSQTTEVQDQIVRLLAELRKARDQQAR